MVSDQEPAVDLDHVHHRLRSMCGGLAVGAVERVEVGAIGRAIALHYDVVRVDAAALARDDLGFLSRRFLAAASAGQRTLGEASLHADAAPLAVGSVRSRSIVDAVERGARSALNPYTGEVEDLRSTLGQDWSLFVHGDDICFASQMGGIMVSVYLETVWVFPNRRLILRIDNGLDAPAVLDGTAKLFARMLRHGPAVAAYLGPGRDARRLALADFSCPHMAHNIWNLQTGWANVLAACTPSPEVEYLVFGGQDFVGTPRELFPSGVSPNSVVTGVSSADEVFELSLTRNLLVCTVKDEQISPGFADRVVAHARALCSPDFLAEVRALRERCRPLVLTTIRLDNRAWLEQQQGDIELFRALKGDFPDIGLILDGLSRDTVKGWTTGWMSLDAELGVARAVRDGLDGVVPVTLAVGRTFAESIVLADSCDLFIAPAGSGMTIYKWICNKPGFAYSNKAVLDEASPHRWPLRVWHDSNFRADVTPTTHLDARFVEDADLARDHPSRANFHMDWRVLHREVLAYMKTAAGNGVF